MITFHGTSSNNAKKINSANVDVELGGGELGRGFYTQEFKSEAKSWAFNVSGDRQQNVVSFDTNDNDIQNLDLIIFDRMEAGRHRLNIKTQSATGSYLFGNDLVWAPIVGTSKVNGEQYKWESKISELLLNDPSLTTKKII